MNDVSKCCRATITSTDDIRCSKCHQQCETVMEEKLYKVKLTYNEICALDGSTNPKNRSKELQDTIDNAKKEHSLGFSPAIINEVILKSEQIGTFSYSRVQMRYCEYCKKAGDYLRYTRSTRYHRKGEKNFDKPTYINGIKFNPGFIRVQGLGDICSECEKNNHVIQTIENYLLSHDSKVELAGNPLTVYKKDPIQICHTCGKEMQESKMGREPAMISGTYPAYCPHCHAKGNVWNKPHQSTDKFVMIKVR